MDIIDLVERLTKVEDQLSILNLLAGSAHSSDVASETFWSNMYTSDAMMDRGGGTPDDVGRDAILAIVRGDGQRAAIAAGMAHLSMLPTITLDGDRASAIGYLLITVPDAGARPIVLPGKGGSDAVGIYQVTVNRWELARSADGWQVTRRIVRALTAEDARSILAKGLEDFSRPAAQ
jgi:hypothetical protein